MSQDNRPEQPNQPRQIVQPVWKAAIIGVLRGTIGVLETTVEKLETAPPPGAEATPSFLQQLESRWSRFLLKARAFIPSNLSTKLSDTALTGIIAGIAVFLLWTTTNIFTSKPTEVATVPPVEEVLTPTPTPTISTPPEVIPSETPPAEEITPEPEAQTPPPEPEVETPPPPEPEAQTPPPEPEAEPEPTPTPKPVIQLTPEQILIAAIEKQLADITAKEDAIASSIVKSIQANFRTSSLTVKINDDWYNLKESEQNQIASQILQRSQELDFSHLEIVDSQDKLIARNPVIGNEMIILQRRVSS